MSMQLKLGKIGEELILTPFGRGSLVINHIEETRGEEMASGRYVEDIKWRKKEFIIAYSEIKGDALAELIYLYELKSFLNFIYYDNQGILRNTEVKMMPFGRTRNSLIGPEVWKDIQIKLRQINPDE